MTREFGGFPDELDWTMQVAKYSLRSPTKHNGIQNMMKNLRSRNVMWNVMWDVMCHFQAAELFELATEGGLQPKTEPHWTAGYE